MRARARPGAHTRTTRAFVVVPPHECHVLEASTFMSSSSSSSIRGANQRFRTHVLVIVISPLSLFVCLAKHLSFPGVPDFYLRRALLGDTRELWQLISPICRQTTASGNLSNRGFRHVCGRITQNRTDSAGGVRRSPSSLKSRNGSDNHLGPSSRITIILPGKFRDK